MNARPTPDVAFEEPWQARVFSLAVLTMERLGRPWEEFRDELKRAVADDPQRAYYDSFVAALERIAEPDAADQAG